MTVKVYDVPDVIEAIRRACDTEGHDYVYEKIDGKCLYVDASNGELRPSCIAAYALVDMGVIGLADLQEWEDLAPLGIGIDMPVTVAALNALGAAQLLQDAGATWGEALKWVDENQDRAASGNWFRWAATEVVEQRRREGLLPPA